MLQRHLDDNHCGGITLLFLFGDGWSQQCSCRHCERSWLNRGWVCPPHYFRTIYLRILDGLYLKEGFASSELGYVDWDAAVVALHAQFAEFADWDMERLLGFARASVARVLLERVLAVYRCSEGHR